MFKSFDSLFKLFVAFIISLVFSNCVNGVIILFVCIRLIILLGELVADCGSGLIVVKKLLFCVLSPLTKKVKKTYLIMNKSCECTITTYANSTL